MIPPALTLLLPGGIPMTFQRLPTVGDPKPFRMGERGLNWFGNASDPVVEVRIAQPFLMGTFPVTQAQFAAWIRESGGSHSNYFEGKPDHPAENMSWFEATAFCVWLSRHGAIPKGWMACLPTEVEWEFACRAGTETEYSTGDGESALENVGWFDRNSDGSTRPVGAKVANAYGLYDLHGNVWEWCHDLFEEFGLCSLPNGSVDPVAARRLREFSRYFSGESIQSGDENPRRVLRGGSWSHTAWLCRSAIRDGYGADSRNLNFGFRVCLVPGPGAQGARGAKDRRAKPAPGAGGRGTRPKADGAGKAVVRKRPQTQTNPRGNEVGSRRKRSKLGGAR